MLKFQQKHPNIYIGGSVSLMLQGVIPYRTPKDIDIISINRIHIYDLFEVKKEKHRLIKRYKHDGLKFDLFINPNAQYVEHVYKGQYKHYPQQPKTTSSFIRYSKKFSNVHRTKSQTIRN